MDVLTRTQVRLVAPGTLLFTLLGLFLGPLMPRMEGTPTQPGGEVFFLTALAAHVGTRLFAGELLGSQGVWLRALPVAAGRLFRVKLAVGFAAIALSGLVQALAWYSGLSGAWFGLVRSDAVYLAPEAAFLPLLFVWAGCTFAASAYFAGAFEWVVASIQAGILGWCSAATLAVMPAGFGVRSSLLEGLALGAAALLFFGAAYRLGLRRGVGASSPQEAMLRDPRPRDAWLTVPSQLLLLALPVSALLYFWTLPGLDAWPVGTRLQKLGGVWLAVGLALAPRSARAIAATGWRGARGLGARLLALTGAGIFVLDAIRPRGPVARCTGCGRRRYVRLGACPHCAANGITAVEDVLRAGPRLPVTPAVWLSLAAGVFVLLVFGLGNRHLYLHGVEIVTDDPELAIVLDGEVAGVGAWREMLVRTPPSPPSDAEKNGVYTIWRRADPAVGGMSMGDLARGIEEDSRVVPGVGLVARQFALRFAPETVVELRRGATVGAIQEVTAQIRFRIARSNLRLQLEARFPEVEERAEAFMQDARLRGALAGDALPLETLDDPLLRASLRYAPVRLLFEQGTHSSRIDLARTPPPEVRAASDLALGRAVMRRFGLDGERSAVAARTIWVELEAKSAGLPVLPWRTFGRGELRRHFRYLYPELRALSIVAPTEDLARRVASGSAHACLVAGLSRRAELFEACADLFRARLRGHWSESEGSAFLMMDPVRLAAGWAMLSIDREGATAVLQGALHGQTRPGVVELACFTGSDAVAARTAAMAAESGEDLGRAFRVASIAAIDRLRERLLAVGNAVEWGVAPEDYFEQAAGFEQHLKPR